MVSPVLLIGSRVAHMRRIMYIFAVAGALLVTGGCGSADLGAGDASDGGAGDVADDRGGRDAGADADAGRSQTLEAAAEAFGSFACGKLEECAPALLEMSYGGSREACLAIETPSLLPVLDQPGFAQNPEQLWGCVDAMMNRDCSVVAEEMAYNFPEECRTPGGLQDGASCVHPFQCQSMMCVVPSGSACGTCRPRLADGSPCTPVDACDFGSQCIQDVCVHIGRRGDDCDAGHPCGQDLFCNGGMCGPPRPLGEDCVAMVGECDLFHGMACNPITKRCVRLKFAEPGADCGLVGDDLVVCKNGDCLPNLLSGKCVAKAVDGDPCDSKTGPLCGFHSTCIDHVCASSFASACPAG